MSVTKIVFIIIGVIVSFAAIAAAIGASYAFGKRSGAGIGARVRNPAAAAAAAAGFGVQPPPQPGMFGAGLPLNPSYQGPPMFAPPYYGPRLPLAERWYESGDSQLTMFDIPNRALGLKGCRGCNPEYSPVCGTDGKTYQNSCCADNADVDIDHAGRCRKRKL